MRLKGCFGQFQTRGIGRETYGGLFRQSGSFMGGAFAGMGSRAGRITIEGVCHFFTGLPSFSSIEALAPVNRPACSA